MDRLGPCNSLQYDDILRRSRPTSRSVPSSQLAVVVGVEMKERAGRLTVADCEACFADLDDRERQCLRLVARNYNSKEIAQRTDLSESAVNKIVFDIRTELGGPYRSQVGRLFTEWEALGSARRRNDDLSPSPHPAISVRDDEGEAVARLNDARAPHSLAEPQEVYTVLGGALPVTSYVPLRVGGKPTNRFSLRVTFNTIAIMAAAALVALGSALSLLSSLSSLNH